VSKSDCYGILYEIAENEFNHLVFFGAALTGFLGVAAFP
jgi:hypothetical protein